MKAKSPKGRSVTKSYSRWVLRYPDGTYFCYGKRSGYSTLTYAGDPLQAKSFESRDAAVCCRDGEAHLRDGDMGLTQLKFKVEIVQRGLLGKPAKVTWEEALDGESE